MLIFIKRHRKILLLNLILFYMGFKIVLSSLRVQCVDPRNKEAGRKSLESDDVEYAILVLSNPDNEEKRDYIRATWAKLTDNIFIENGVRLYKWTHTLIGGNAKHSFIKLYFAVGVRSLSNVTLVKLDNEIQKRNDILQLDLEDSYKTLTTKVLYSLKWLNSNLKSLKYVVKCDDDSFVRIDLIVRDLEAYAPAMNAPALNNSISSQLNLPPFNGLYWGYFEAGAYPITYGKWRETSWFLCDSYFPYAFGGGYVISKSIVDFVSTNADILSLYHSEDVSMGVWTAALHINRVHDNRFDTEWKTRGCNQDLLIRHKQTTNNLFQMYMSLVHSQGEELCDDESTEREAYFYNWRLQPHNCCHILAYL